MTFGMKMAAAFLVLFGVVMALTFEHPPISASQQGYRGTGMVEVHTVDRISTAAAAAADVPEPQPPASVEGPRAGEVYQNVQVLGDLSQEQFFRVMMAMTQWVSPEQGCTYCHDDEGNFALDNKYTKVVSRRMLEMTRHINTDWTSHVADTGVTCYTCHRGRPVPAYIWFAEDKDVTRGMAANTQGQDHPSPAAGMTSLPSDPLTPFLAGSDPSSIRVVGQQALPAEAGIGASIKDAEDTYALMMNISGALGVNCTYCHNSRSFTSWEQSNSPRVTAFHGLDMVRNLNNNFLGPLQSVFPPARLGPHGDSPKVACSTCHQGASKPLSGVKMLANYPELVAVREPGTASDAAAAPAEEPLPAAQDSTMEATAPETGTASEATSANDAAPEPNAAASEPDAATPDQQGDNAAPQSEGNAGAQSQ